MMMLEESPNTSDYLITQEKLEERKGSIPRAGPKYRLGMYFETIHNLPSFDAVSHHDEGGYTSYWETDTEVDSDLGNFIFNNVSGDSASLICLDDTIDLLALHKRQQDVISSIKQQHHQPHYKLEQNRTSPSSPSEDHPLERSIESKHSSHSRQSHRSGSDGTYDHPPPVPPPRRPSTTAANATSTDFQDHTYETLDDCQEDYLAHQGETIYVSKGSEGSRDSHGSTAKPASNDDTESDRLSSSKGAEDFGGKSPDRNACSGGSSGDRTSKPRSMSLHMNKPRESVNYRQRRKMSDPSSTSRKRRSEKVASKGSGYPAPLKGFPAGVSEEYAEYLSQPMSGHLSPERIHTSGSGSPVAPCQRDIATGSPDRRRNSDTQKSSTLQHVSQPKKLSTTTTAAPLVIKHKGKTYFVPVVDQKLEKELEKRSRTNNPTVSIKHQTIGPLMSRSNGIFGSSAIAGANHTHRLHASPPKVESSDYASPHKKKASSFKSPPHTANTKQVKHYGVL